ncbi:HAMP domain-containing protein [Ramlibacter sp. B156]|uniref:HAMP domain-containing protein n=1 Tax=Ramlibacter montanisoli TaxID=2732512 RepID=A0A849K7W1_9BURK|nr:HAMP domain-containing protein [Ramlibacter montanisoli]
MRIWHKILIAPGLAILFLLAFGLIAYGVASQQNEALRELAQKRLAGVVAATDASQDISEVHSNVYRLFTWIANLPEEKVKKATAEQKAKIDAVAAGLTAFRAQPHVSAQERQLVDAVLPMMAKYRKLQDDAIDMATIEVATGAMMMQAADSQFLTMVKNLDELVQLQKKLAQESYESAAAASRAATLLLSAMLVVAVAAAAAAALLMSRAIVRPLHAAIRTAQRIAQGDLSTEVHVRGSDETGDLLRALADMNQNLRQLVGEVSGGAHMVADTSAQIAQGNQDLSQRTEEQASTLEETASSMEELTSTVSLNAQNARQASQLAMGASDVARKGGQVVGQVVSTMAGISDSSRKIGDIIGVIDGIAFQTNILALNAAVEAAARGRAGPRLRGGGRGSAQPRAAQRSGRQGDQGPDRRVGRQGRHRRQAGGQRRQDDGRDRGIGEEGQRPDRGDRGGERGAGRRHPAGQHRRDPDGPGGAAERVAGRGGRGRHRVHEVSGFLAAADGGALQAQRRPGAVHAGAAAGRARAAACAGAGAARAHRSQAQCPQAVPECQWRARRTHREAAQGGVARVLNPVLS